MAAPERPNEAIVEELLDILRGDEAAPPDDLEQTTLRKVRASVTLRDLFDLTTSVFVLRFCAPILDLIVGIVIATGLRRERGPG